MPRLVHMTWIRSQKRWTKRYKGERYYVSPRELKCPPTEAASLLAANQWWEEKEKQINGAAEKPKPGSEEAIRALLEAWRGAPLQTQEEAAAAMLEIVDHFKDSPVPPVVAEAVLGPERMAQVEAGAEAALDGPTTPTERTVGKLVELFTNTEKQRVRAGKVGLSRANMNRICLEHFSKFLGPHSPVEVVSETKWLEFYNFLAGQMENGVWGASHCDRIFTVSRRWVKFLWEMRLIELPRNLENRALSFTNPPKEIEIFTLEELKRLVAITTGQSALHILLMLNCGCIGKDINDLRHDEVDWKEGIVTRKRSKTAKHQAVPVVRYKLWGRTFELLQKHRSADPEIVLLTEKGGRWITESAEGSTYNRSDMVGRNVDYWLERAKVKHPPKALRATAASKLGEHPQYKFYAQYYLGQSPRSVAEKHYVRPSENEFFDALAWLEGALGFEGEK